MNILIIDDSAEYRDLLELHLKKQITDAVVIGYDVVKLGKPDKDFDWSEYDVLFLDYKLGLAKDDGLIWLTEFRENPDLPPVIFLTGEGSEYVAVRAIKLGAADYINKADASPRRIANMIYGSIVSKRVPLDHQKDVQEARSIIKDICNSNATTIDFLKFKSTKEKAPPKRFDYKFIKLIGEGAMSKVYLAEHGVDKSVVVLKIIDLFKTKDRKITTRFLQEAELISQLNSSYIVKIYDHGVVKEYGYIAMEFFSRGDLKLRMETDIACDVAVGYVKEIARALEQTHAIGIVHRDLKPANIMFRAMVALL